MDVYSSVMISLMGILLIFVLSSWMYHHWLMRNYLQIVVLGVMNIILINAVTHGFSGS